MPSLLRKICKLCGREASDRATRCKACGLSWPLVGYHSPAGLKVRKKFKNRTMPDRKHSGWRCCLCGHIVTRDRKPGAPSLCPRCGGLTTFRRLSEYLRRDY